MNKTGEISLLYILTSGIIISLFIILFINFAVNLGMEYNLNETDVSSPFFNTTGLQTEISKTQNTSSSAFGNMTEDKTWLGELLDVLPISPMLKLARTIWNLIKTPYDILIYGLKEILGLPEIIVYSIVALLFITISFSIWRLFKTGS